MNIILNLKNIEKKETVLRMRMLFCLIETDPEEGLHETAVENILKFESRISQNSLSLSLPPQGGVEDKVTLSAYVTIALLEIPLPVTVRFTSISFPMETTGLMSGTPPTTSQVSTSFCSMLRHFSAS